MGRVQTADPDVYVSEDVFRQLGYDPLSIPMLSESELLEFIRGMNHHIKQWTVRSAIRRKDLRGVRKGKKFLFSKREAIRWMQTSDDDSYGGDAA